MLNGPGFQMQDALKTWKSTSSHARLSHWQVQYTIVGNVATRQNGAHIQCIHLARVQQSWDHLICLP